MGRTKFEDIVWENFEHETDVDHVMNFAIVLGEQLVICGGEIWRAEELLNTVFKIYDLEDTSVIIWPNIITISARRAGHKFIMRQKNIESPSVNLEKLTRLKVLVRDLGKNKVEPEKLLGLLKNALDVPEYPFLVNRTAMTCALLSLVYLFHGTFLEALVVVVCTIGIQLIKTIVSQLDGTNNMGANAISSFFAGVVALLSARIGIHVNPYQIMIICSFAMLPGIPLINSARELLYGRVMSGCFMILQVIFETLFIVAGFFLAIALFGGF